MDMLKELGEFLNTYGGWGVCIILGYWIHRQDKAHRVWRDKIAERFEEHHASKVKLVSKNTAALKSVAAEMRSLYDRLPSNLGKPSESTRQSISGLLDIDD